MAVRQPEEGRDSISDVPHRLGPLAGLRVLDLTGRRGAYCGKLLANLGADVVLVEPPGGDPMRHQEPPAFEAYHTNKFGIELDADSPELRELAEHADVLIYDRSPGLKLPHLVTASITGFGESGPYAGFASTNIVSMAMSGLMSTAGFPDRPPLQGPGEAAHKMASIHAAFGILVALFSGKGQHVEVSEQEVLAADPFRRMVLDYSVRGEFVQRDGTISAELVAGSYPTNDGYANFYVQVPSHWRRLVEWLGSPPEISDPSFEKEEVQREHRETIDRLIEAKSRTYGKKQLAEELQEKHLAVGSVNTVAEFLDDEQTKFRGFAGAPYVFSESPTQTGSPGEVFKGPSSWKAPNQSLEGIRVVSFPTGVVGPCIGRLLGDHGAEVIAIEAKETTKPSLNAWTLAQVESNRMRKRVSLDMNKPEAQELARQLIAKADVLTDNFSSRVLKKWGLDYPSVQKINPSIVMISLQSFGNSGPKGGWISYGSTLLAHSGYSYLWQDPERQEQGVGCNTYFPDYVAPSYGALAVMAALHYRAKTGKGQYIDLSQAETSAALLGTELLEPNAQPRGNTSPFMAPHGCYRCLGHDRWCVIAVENEEQWQAFCKVTGIDPSADRRSVDHLISRWTECQTPHQVMIKLQAVGVAAGVVANSEDLYLDPHMRERGFTKDIQHPEYGRMTQVGRTVNLSETPGPPLDTAHEIGADNSDVFGRILGLTADQLNDLEAKGVFGA